MKRTALLLGTLVAASLVIGPTVTAGTAVRVRPAPKLSNPTATATKLSNQFFTLLVDKDIPGLTKFLSPAFQVQRADGSGSGKKAWLALPGISSSGRSGVFRSAALTACAMPRPC